MENIVTIAVGVVSLIISLMLICAVLRIFAISHTLNDILKKLNDIAALQMKSDRRRREEFDAMMNAQG